MTTTRLKDWLEISTDGFAQRQIDRRPQDLAKEIYQNALDAVEGQTDGRVAINLWSLHANADLGTVRRGQKRIHYIGISVTDNGPGVSNVTDLRTVFCSGKEDSFLLRGRMGQGFKEILCLAAKADVWSSTFAVHFRREAGVRVTDVEDGRVPAPGTKVEMILQWPEDALEDLILHAKSLIPPEKCAVIVNGDRVPPREVSHSLDVSLKTEVFTDGRWARRERDGRLDLVRVLGGAPAMIFEMGIPICEIDWPQPYHINVHMRVPMNPRRDAVATGYMQAVYSRILPKLKDTLDAESLRDEWVSLAVESLPEADQQDLVTKAFGTNAVREVPTMGKHDFNSDARELGYTPIQTRLLPSGLRAATEKFMPTSKDVEMDRRFRVNTSVEIDDESTEEKRTRVWAAWLAKQVLGMEIDVRVVEDLVINDKVCAASWTPGCILTLNRSAASAWTGIKPVPVGTLIHEMAHEIAAHHGDDFRRAVEEIAGRTALVFLKQAATIQADFSDLL